MAKKFKLYLIVIAVAGFFVTACGKEPAPQPSFSSEASSSMQLQDTVRPDGTTDMDKFNEYLGVDVIETEMETMEEVPENVIMIAVKNNDYMDIANVVMNFNLAQKEYKVEVKRYETYDSMMLDMVRGQGCDIMILNPSYLKVLGEKSALEDLTPYFESSEVVQKENLFEAAWSSGTVGDKMMGIIPSFFTSVVLVEKGYTEDGGWTLDEYLDLMDINPEVPISHRVDSENYANWFINELCRLPELFVDWETRTCNFDSKEFADLITKIKEYAMNASSGYGVLYTLQQDADLLLSGKEQTMLTNFDMGSHFFNYKDLRNTFLDKYEMAGIPNSDGEPEYMLSTNGIIYSMNSLSAKKDKAWLFFEYMLSAEYQEILLNDATQAFPVRRDLLIQRMQEEMVHDPDARVYKHTNRYTGEKIEETGLLYQEDIEQILYILDHVSGHNIYTNGDFAKIFSEEMDAFWSGDKSAEEIGKLLQSRISLFLME